MTIWNQVRRLESTTIGLNYHDKKSKQELDFISRNRISIIEVKSGDNYQRYASLDVVIDAHEDKIDRDWS